MRRHLRPSHPKVFYLALSLWARGNPRLAFPKISAKICTALGAERAVGLIYVTVSRPRSLAFVCDRVDTAGGKSKYRVNLCPRDIKLVDDCSTLAPASRFSNIAETGTRVSRRTHAPLNRRVLAQKPYANATRQYSTHLAISFITSDPSGVLYSNSIVP